MSALSAQVSLSRAAPEQENKRVALPPPRFPTAAHGGQLVLKREY